MINIEGTEGAYTIDFNESESNSRLLKINSTIGKMTIPWSVSYNPFPKNVVRITKMPDYSMKVEADLSLLKKENFFIVTNPRREEIKVFLKPNLELSRERIYIFKLGKSTTSGNSATINVISKENGKPEPWHVEYDGRPLKYDIQTKQNKITVTLLEDLLSSFTSTIVLEQDNSGKQIEFRLKHEDSDSVEVIEG